MIIDLNTRAWASLDQLGAEAARALRAQAATRWHHLDASPAAHEQAMSCVDGSLVMGYRADRLGAHVPNEYIAQIVTGSPHRRLGVAGIDPMSDDALDQVDAALDLGLVAISVSPACQGFHPAHSAAMRIYERCVELTMPLFIATPHPYTASSILDFAHPALWDEVARTYPQLPIVICQLGHPWVDQALVLVSKHENVYAEISGVASRPWQLYNALLSASSFGVMDKLLFGSDFPFDTPAKAIEAMYSINGFSQGTQLPSIPRASIRAIVERDALSRLGIDGEIAPRPDQPDLEPDGARADASALERGNGNAGEEESTT